MNHKSETRNQVGGIENATRVPCTGLERAEMLDATRWANDFEWRQVKRLATFMRAYEADKGAAILNEGDRSSFMCLIVSGSVDILKEDSEEGTKHLAVLGPGNTFGEMELLDAGPRSASVVPAEKTLLLVFTKQDLDALAEDAPLLALKLVEKIARMMSQRLRKTTGALSEYLERMAK